MKKLKIILPIILILAIIAWFIYKMLYPTINLEQIENKIQDKSIKDWATLESTVLKNENRNVYFGDMHIHTGYSFDAFIGGIVATPDDAYKYAKGNSIEVLGQNNKLERPLDFAAVTDHSEYFGELYSIQNQGAPAYNAMLPRYFRSVIGDTIKQRELFLTLLRRVGKVNKSHLDFFQGYETTMKTWDIEVKAAEENYNPGKFTTFAAYEWTQGVGVAHNHRNIFFKDMVVPDYPISAVEAPTVTQLWTSLESFRQGGATVMAVPHNPNLSEGFAFEDSYPDGRPIDLEYARLSNLNEPLAEIHQAKGNSEVHASLWQNDEYADFENYSQGEPKKNNYIRHMLKKGLEYEDKLGTNPYKFGLIGSTDTHNATPGNTEEDDAFIGNHASVDLAAKQRASRAWILDTTMSVYETVNPGGLMAVWADANTRPEIYDAMVRKETYATSGTRIQVRFFAGYDLNQEATTYDDLVSNGYRNGVHMGSSLLSSSGEGSPTFSYWASKDPEGANLKKIQVIKGYYQDGEIKEEIFDVSSSGNKVPQGNEVDLNTGQWNNENGSAVLQGYWQDPNFDSSLRAFYYLRILEVKTPRWNLWDELKYGVKYPESTPKTIHERAWSSPIWISPNS